MQIQITLTYIFQFCMSEVVFFSCKKNNLLIDKDFISCSIIRNLTLITMKFIKNLFLALTCFLIVSCNNPGKKSVDIREDSSEIKENKKLSLEEQAKNTYMNTTSIISGIMILSLSEMFQGTMKSFTGSFNGKIDTVDAIIKSMNTEISAQLDTMVTSMDKIFNEVLTENISIYNKLFSKEILKEGVSIASKYELPEGFRPLTQDLSPSEIKRYIIYTLSIPKEEQKTDELGKMLTELSQWLQEVDKEIKADSEIADFFSTLK